MELTYQSPMMPAAYAVISADEMTYIDGGALQIGSYLIEFHPENLLTAAVNFTVNFAQLMGKAALTAAVGGLLLMHEDGLTLSQSVSYYWDGQNKAGKAATVAGGGRPRRWGAGCAATVAVGALAGWYGAMQAIQIYNTVKSIFIELKNAYAQTKANIAASQQQNVGITDPIVAAAA